MAVLDQARAAHSAFVVFLYHDFNWLADKCVRQSKRSVQKTIINMACVGVPRFQSTSSLD